MHGPIIENNGTRKQWPVSNNKPQAELITHAELRAQEYNGAMNCLREQAANKEAEFKQRMEEYSAALKAKEKEVLDLKAALTDAKEWNLREEERNR